MLKYQKIVMRAHEAFHRRLRQVEVELAEAKRSLEQLDIRYSVHERKAQVWCVCRVLKRVGACLFVGLRRGVHVFSHICTDRHTNARTLWIRMESAP